MQGEHTPKGLVPNGGHAARKTFVPRHRPAARIAWIDEQRDHADSSPNTMPESSPKTVGTLGSLSGCATGRHVPEVAFDEVVLRLQNRPDVASCRSEFYLTLPSRADSRRL
jgi:hypothetical protein